MELESTIVRGLAVVALGAALVAAAYIAFNSGVVGGRSNGAVAVPTTAASGASASAADSGGAGAAAAAAPDTAGGQEATPAVTKTYTVQDGDSFSSIARKFNTTISEIQKLNPSVNPQNLSVGLKLNIP